MVLPVPIQLSVRVYETEESSHGRQGTLSADGLFFSFWFRSMARPLVFRRRRPIKVQEFLQSWTRIPSRSRAGTGSGNGGICRDCAHIRLAGALHDLHGRKIAQQRSAAQLIVWLFRLITVAVWAREIRRDTRATVLGRNHGGSCFRSPHAERGSAEDNLPLRPWCRCRSF